MLTTLICCASLIGAHFDTPKTSAEIAFAHLKSMAGTWTGEADDGRKIVIKYETIAAGSVVMHSSNFEAHPGEKMVTMFRMDGDRLILTHYCVAKNQPTLVATKFEDRAKKVTFTFESATNLKNRNQGHMDKAVYEFKDDDTYTAKWTWYQDGEETWMENFTLRRQK